MRVFQKQPVEQKDRTKVPIQQPNKLSACYYCQKEERILNLHKVLKGPNTLFVCKECYSKING